MKAVIEGIIKNIPAEELTEACETFKYSFRKHFPEMNEEEFSDSHTRKRILTTSTWPIMKEDGIEEIAIEEEFTNLEYFAALQISISYYFDGV